MDKKVKDLRRGDRITINGVTATISSTITVDGKTYILCDPIPIGEAQKMAGVQKEHSENRYEESEQYRWMMGRFLKGEQDATEF